MPDVIEFKTSTLSKLGAEPTAERRTVAVDLRDDWPAALQAAGFDPQAPAAWSAEGLVVYLPPEAQDALFDNVTALSAAGSQLASEFVPDTTIFTDQRWRAHHERMSELGFDLDFNDLVYHFERSHIIEYLTQARLAGFAPHGRAVACRQRLRLPRRRSRGGLRRRDLPQRRAELTSPSAAAAGPRCGRSRSRRADSGGQNA